MSQEVMKRKPIKCTLAIGDLCEPLNSTLLAIFRGTVENSPRTVPEG
jgi:hypothetical protein